MRENQFWMVADVACQVRNTEVLFWLQSGTSKQNEEAFQRGYTLLFD